jgi:hypothetical protein
MNSKGCGRKQIKVKFILEQAMDAQGVGEV